MTENHNSESESSKVSEDSVPNKEELGKETNLSNEGKSNQQVNSNDNSKKKSNEDDDLKNKSENNEKQKVEHESQIKGQPKEQPESEVKLEENNDVNRESGGNSKAENEVEGEPQVEDKYQEENESLGVIDSPGLLKRKKERVDHEIKQKNKEYDILGEKIGVIIDAFQTVIDPLGEESLKQRKLKLEKDKKVILEQLQKLEDELNLIEKKLKQYDSTRRKSFRERESTESVKETKKTSPESLFENAEQIENTLLYVVTFFDNLSPHDFERVVSWLLEGRKTIIKVKSQVTTEQGEIKTIEESQDKLMTEIWHESLQNPDRLLSNCCIGSVTLEDDSQVIDFVFPQLREKFKDYFKREQPLYLSKQFEQAKFLLFYPEVKVAIGAMSLSVYMATISPNAYGREWLFEIITWVPLDREVNPESAEELLEGLLKQIESAKQRWFIYGRVSSLIAQMLDYPRLHSVADSFFNGLIGQADYGIALEIAKRLFSHPQFDGFYWLKQLLDRGNEKVKNGAYKFLYRHLNQSGLYIFDSLEKIKLWLPEPDASPDRYSPSNEYSLRLLPEYCIQTIDRLDANYYGNFPPQYSLLGVLYSGDSIEEKLNVLFAWLFHPEFQNAIYKYLTELANDRDNQPKNLNTWKDVYEMAVKGLEDDEPETDKSSEKSSDNKNQTTSYSKSPTTLMVELLIAGYSFSLEELLSYFCPLLLTEWCIILWGLDNKEAEEEAIELINTLIQQVVAYPTNSHKEHKERKERFVQCWRILTEYLLNQAEFFRKLGESHLKKQYMRRRNVVRFLNKQFKSQMKKSSLIKE